MSRTDRSRIALAAVLSIIFACPVAGAAPPSGTAEQEDAGAARRPVRSAGPRRTGLGGARAKAPARMKRLGGTKIPFQKHRQLLPSRKLNIGGVRSRAPDRISGLPRRDVPDLLPSAAPDAASVDGVVASRMVERAAGGFDAGRSLSQRAFAEALRRHGVADADVGPRIRVDPRSVPGTPGDAAERARLLGQLRERLASNPGLARAVRDQVMDGAPAHVALETARRELLAQGFVEIELGPGDYGFVRPRGPETMQRIGSQLGRIRSVADSVESQGRARLVRGRGDGRIGETGEEERASLGREVSTAAPGTPVDPFVQGNAPAAVPAPAAPMAPAAPASAAAVEPELAAAAGAWADGDFDAAAAAFASYLRSSPEDTEVRRLLGLSLLLAGRTAAGIEALGIAYETDPNLAARPVARESFEGHSAALRRAVADSVAVGHRSREHRAWLAASVLMHAEGRGALAARMLDRAVQCGLPDEIETELRLALGS